MSQKARNTHLLYGLLIYGFFGTCLMVMFSAIARGCYSMYFR